MDALLSDVAYLVASIRRNGQFAATALLTLALGIGATTTVFSVVYNVLLRPLPYPESDRLVGLSEEHPGAPRPPGDPQLSNLTMNAWRARTHTLEDIAAYYAREYSVTVADVTTRVHGGEASTSLFPLLRATPSLGRFFQASDEAPKANAFVIIADRFWRERLGARPDVIGLTLGIDGRPSEIVGVARPEFHFPDRDAQIWTPYDDPTRLNPSVQGGMWLSQALGRMKPGVSLAQVEAEGTTAAQSVPRPAVANLLFGLGGRVQVRAETLAGRMTAAVRPVLVVLAASVVLVLLVACANVANLFLSRGVARQRELAVRAAIGASRGRLVRQLLTESLVLSGCGGVLGVGLAWAMLNLAPALAPHDFPRLDVIHPDFTVVIIATAASILTALLAGLVPAARGARFDLSASLHGGDGATADGFRGARARRLRDAFVLAEAALAAALLVGAALLGRSFVRLVRVDVGYDPNNVLIARVHLRNGSSPDRSRAFTSALLDQLYADRRVTAVGAGNMMPFSDATWITGFALPDSAGPGKPTQARALLYVVTTGFADALGLHLREGRWFNAGDTGLGRLPVVVNEEFAHQYLSAGPVAGRSFKGGPLKAPTTDIIGVVGNVLKDGSDTLPRPEVYALERQDHVIQQDEVDLVVRTLGDPASLASTLRDAVHNLDREAAVDSAQPLSQRLSASMHQPRFAAIVLWSFAGLALVLASVGLYSVISYAVSQRRRELSLRVALGATRGDLVRMVLGEGVALTLGGTAVGLLAATGLARLISRLLFGITPLDAASYAEAAAILLPVVTVACLLPALRAARTDPARVLRLD